MTEDPFSCFGEEDIDNDNVVSPEYVSTKIQELIECANQRLVTRSSYPISVPIAKGASNDWPTLSMEGETPPSQYDNPWANRPPPLYKHPALFLQTLNDEVGGGRGYTAACDLKPGTLLLIEEPVSTLDSFYASNCFESELGIETLYYMLFQDQNSSKTHNLIRDMESLHPTKAQVDDLFQQGQDGIIYLKDHTSTTTTLIPQIVQVQIIDRIQDMLTKYSTHPLMTGIIDSFSATEDSKTLSSLDICRMILVLRYNCFESGLYLHFSMFNHSESSNCIKYMPPSNEEEDVPSRPFSEARTTRPVAKGESLTLNYIPPHREVSHATRRHYLWDQHRFDIGDESIPLHVQEMEYVVSSLDQNILPPSFVYELDETTITFGIEKAIIKFEDEWSMLHPQISILLSQKAMGDASTELLHRLLDLEKDTFDYITQSIAGLGNPQHILLLRLHRLHVDILDLIIKISRDKSITQDHDVVTHIDRLARFIQSTRTLLNLEVQAWGPDHPDVARTHQDIAHALSYIVSNSPYEWFRRRVQGLSTHMECAKVEAHHRKEYHRIQSLYPEDIDQYLKSTTNH